MNEDLIRLDGEEGGEAPAEQPSEEPAPAEPAAVKFDGEEGGEAPAEEPAPEAPAEPAPAEPEVKLSLLLGKIVNSVVCESISFDLNAS